jgi:toxin FitB
VKSLFLVDTNIVSELSRRQANPGVLSWADTVTVFCISVITVEEISFGLSFKPNMRVQSFFDRFMAGPCEILPLTSEIAQIAGTLRGDLMARGIVRAQADLLIAATAKIHRLTLVTRNLRDFTGIGIPLLDPFT